MTSLALSSVYGGGIEAAPISRCSGSAFVPGRTERRSNRMHISAVTATDDDFASEWGTFIRRNFRDRTAIKRAFGVSERTAVYWENGERPPRGRHVAKAVLKYGFLSNG